MKRFLSGLLVGLMLATASWAVAAEQPIKLIVNGKEVPSDPAPRMIDNRVFVPVRFVAEALGADVNWDDANRAVVVTTNATAKNSININETQGYFTGRFIVETLSAKFPDKKIWGLGATDLLYIDDEQFTLPSRLVDNKLYFSVQPLIEAGYWD